MRGLAIILIPLGLAVAGCQSRMVMCGGGVAYPTPVVTLEGVTEVPGSPGRGYPVSHFPMPVFPHEMVRAGIAGEVIIRAKVGADGLVQSASVIKTTQREFGPPAVNAVERWRFFEYLDPGVSERRGMIVDCRIIFALDES